MLIKINYRNFRNLEDGEISFSEKTNVFFGNNAQGKTNLLELLYLFSGSLSFRSAKDNEIVKFEKDGYEAELDFFSEERKQTASIKFFKETKKKEILINDIPKNSRIYLMEKIKAVIFSPEHLSLVKDGPGERRRFIDAAISSQKTKNAALIAKYNKILIQRNALLKDISKHSELKETLPIWDENISYFGSLIAFERLEYIKKLREKAKVFHKGISKNKEELEIFYKSGFLEEEKEDYSVEEIKDLILESLKKNYYSDERNGSTTVGIHRDDVEIKINGKSARMYGSQGQQRSAVISLKLAEAALIEKTTGEKPVIMLDDVLSELDEKRQNFLMEKIKDFQVFITTCEGIKKSDEIKAFEIKDGKVKTINNE